MEARRAGRSAAAERRTIVAKFLFSAKAAFEIGLAVSARRVCAVEFYDGAAMCCRVALPEIFVLRVDRVRERRRAPPAAQKSLGRPLATLK